MATRRGFTPRSASGRTWESPCGGAAQHRRPAADRGSGVELRSLREPWLHSIGPVGDIVVAVLAWVAQQERERIRDRVIAGLERAKRRGTKSGKAIGRPRIHVDREGARLAVTQAGS